MDSKKKTVELSTWPGRDRQVRLSTPNAAATAAFWHTLHYRMPFPQDKPVDCIRSIGSLYDAQLQS